MSDEYIENRLNRRPSPPRSKSLAKLRPDLAREWNARNPITPEDVSLGSRFPALWTCSNCGHVWSALVKNRATSPSTGCPECAKLRRHVRKHRPFFAAQPRLLKEIHLHPSLRSFVRDYDDFVSIAANSTRKLPWKCLRCGNVWTARVGNRTRGSGCPKCGALRDASKQDRLAPGSHGHRA